MHLPQIPEETQIRAMLEHSVDEMLRQYVDNVSSYNLRKYLTVRRSRIVEFLNTHPELTEAYFRRHSAIQRSHDAENIWQEGPDYVTAWMDHGHPQSIRRFKTLPEAVAEHVLVEYGMY
jgi:hypothetical protein